MVKDNSKPDGYYDSIDYLYKRKDEVAALFTNHKVIEHTNAEQEYDYLEDDDVTLEIVNPYWNKNLFIEFSDEFTLYFSNWHTHFAPYEYDFSKLKEVALGITDEKFGALCFFVEDKWFGSIITDEDIFYFTDPQSLIEKMKFSNEKTKIIKDKGVFICVEYWHPSDYYEFDVPKKSDPKPKFTFPRRSGVRSVMRDGKCYGSGSQKEYDKDTAMITYVCVDEIENAELETEIIKLLEKDAKKNGANKIFANIEKSDFERYSSLGYAKVERIDNDRVHYIQGAIVGFDITVMKEL